MQVQPMIHHDNRPREQAMAEAAPKFKEKLDRIIDEGRGKMSAAIDNLMSEAKRRNDFIVPPTKMQFLPATIGPDPVKAAKDILMRMDIPGGGRDLKLNDYSTNQVLSALSIPREFMDKLWSEEPEIAAGLMNDLRYRMVDDKRPLQSRRLVREVDGIVRGFLSGSYRRMNQENLIETFLDGLRETSAIPMEGKLMDRRYLLRAIAPRILNPLPNEYVIIGTQVSSSEYGSGARNLSVFQIRGWCTNLAVGESVLREIHLGGNYRDNDDGLVEWSEETNDLRDATSRAEFRDAMRAILSPENANKIEESWRKAALEHIDTEGEVKKLRRQNILSKELGDNLITLVANESRIEVLPQTADPSSRLRFSQALSWLAQTATGERQHELELTAGKYLSN